MSIRRTSAYRHVPVLCMLLIALFSFHVVKGPTTVPTTHVTAITMARASTIMSPLAISPHGH